MIQKIWYASVKLFLKISLQFYAKKIIVKGEHNIPKKGAVLFAINHPNALMDPLFVTSNNPRVNHFLVRADVFKKPLIKKILASLNLMPIFRIRDGRKQLSNNEEVFEKCFSILKKQETLIIFPQGGHCRNRKIQPLSKGFTRIVFGALEKYTDLNITVIPVGITYQNSATFPCKVAVNYGEAINSRQIFEENEKAKAILVLKDKVYKQLTKLSVHIADDENYTTILSKLNAANVDFTNVALVNKMIAKNIFPPKEKKRTNYFKPLFFIIILNSFLPYLIWKRASKNPGEIEFLDTFRYGLNVISFPLFYFLQALIITVFYGSKIGILYFIVSFFLVLFYTKLSLTNTENV